jgi:putative tryptophan/tyrosine transport system substrate-binding protein
VAIVRRRDFITLLGGAAAWPLAAQAQQPAVPVVGYFSFGPPPPNAGFREGLSEMGFVEGSNITIEYRFAEGQSERLPAMAADLVQRRMAVIAAGPRALDAAKAATATIPIVFMAGGDPVTMGLVANLNHPGGNLTGVTALGTELTSKRLGLLRDLVPQAKLIGALADWTIADLQLPEVQAVGRSLGLPIRIMTVDGPGEYESAFANLAREGAGALFVINSANFVTLRVQLIALAARYRIPASYEFRDFVEAGGLMSYGPSLRDNWRQVGLYTGRILKGERPGDLPVLLPAKFEFVLNLKTAKALSLEVPSGVSAIADEVIE